MVNPGIGTSEARQWPHCFGVGVQIGGNATLNAPLDKARQALVTVEVQVTIAPISQVAAKVAVPLRRSERMNFLCWV